MVIYKILMIGKRLVSTGTGLELNLFHSNRRMARLSLPAFFDFLYRKKDEASFYVFEEKSMRIFGREEGGKKMTACSFSVAVFISGASKRETDVVSKFTHPKDEVAR